MRERSFGSDSARNQRKSSRAIRPMLFAMLATVLLFAACAPGDDVAAGEDINLLAEQESSVIAVETAEVVQGRLRESIEASGVIQGIREVIIRPFASGVIESVSVELGQDISSNEVLLKLDDRIARLTWQQLAGEYQSALADLESQKNLYERGSLSLNQLNQIQARVDGLAAQVEQARDALAYTSVTSPIEGSIADIAENLIPGDLVSSGQQIARVVDLSRLRIQLSLGQDQIFLVTEDLPAEILISSPRGVISIDGQVSAVAAGSDQSTGSWKVVVSFDNPAPEIIKAGMSAEVRIRSNLEPLRDLVPVSSLILNDGSAELYLADDDVAVRVPVRVMDSYGEFAAVEAVGDLSLTGRRVLTSGLSRIRSGDRIVFDTADVVSGN
jgi:membrane fusion protein (multidrug efflux system)